MSVYPTAQTLSCPACKVSEVSASSNAVESKFSSNLNTGMLGALLMGMYSIIYMGTMYLYFSRTLRRHLLVPATVTILYMCNVAQFAVEWFCTNWQFTGEGGSTGHSSTSAMQLGLEVAANVLALIAIFLGDGLLIWRCFILWSRSLRIMFMLTLLVVVESALLLTQIIRRAMFNGLSWTAEPALLGKFDIMAAAGFIVAACTTLITTSLIAYRIYSFSERQVIPAGRFRHIIDIVVQSGAVYSLCLLGYGVAALTGFTVVQGHGLTYWAQSFVFDISGISTTVMVARVALLADETIPFTSKENSSDIRFQTSSITHIEPQVLNITRSFDLGRALPTDEEKVHAHDPVDKLTQSM